METEKTHLQATVRRENALAGFLETVTELLKALGPAIKRALNEDAGRKSN
jgi:hypothetical protein